MIGKKGKLATLLFVGVFTLPLLGLLIMDYQVRVANDLTGNAIMSPGAESSGMLVAAVVLGLIVAVLVVAAARWVKHSRFVRSLPMSRVNEEIRRIEDHMRMHKEKR